MTARSLWRAAVLAALVAAVPLLGPGCGSEDEGTASKAPPAAAATPQPPRPQPPAVDSCTLVTKAEAEAALGMAVGDPVRGDVPPVYSCTFQSADRLNNVSVTVTSYTDARQAHDAYVMAVKINDYKEFEGLGDRAYESLVSDVNVLKGRFEVSVDLSSSLSKDVEVKRAREIAARALERLPQ
jgi:hypothetical protein